MRHWNYETLDGKVVAVRSPRSHWITWIFWKAMAILSLVIAIFFAFADLHSDRINSADLPAPRGLEGVDLAEPESVLYSFIARSIGLTVSLIMMLKCNRRGDRYHPPRADMLLRRDRRAPVVYLRGFEEDELQATTGLWSAGRPRLENLLSRHFRKVGPFLAVGSPRDRLPFSGAARIYVDDASWQIVVDDLIRRARAVVIQTACTPGLRWELTEATRLLKPSKLFILISSKFHKGKSIQARHYEDFRSWASDLLPLLPGSPGRATFIRFRDAPPWCAELIGRGFTLDDRDPVLRVVGELARNKMLEENIYLERVLNVLAHSLKILFIVMGIALVTVLIPFFIYWFRFR
jgi:hypothetical protein